MLSKVSQYESNEYNPRNQTNDLNNNIQGKSKKYKKLVEEKRLHRKKTCYACGSKEHLIKK